MDESKNHSFIFKRNFMEYHSDRFRDNSLLVISNKKVMGLLPATNGDSLISHED